jgi:hypothetical protein
VRSTTPTPVALVHADVDSPVAARLYEYLYQRSVPAWRGRSQVPGACSLVLLSAQGVSNPEVLSASNDTSRLVPVKIGAFDEGSLPPRIRQLNWIVWDPSAQEQTCAMVLVATQTDLEDYRDARGLEAKAWAWHLSGRRSDELITDLRRLKALTQNAPGVRIGAPSDLRDHVVADFRRLSLVRARTMRRWRRLRWALAVLLVPTILSASIALYDWVLSARVAGALQVGTADFTSNRRPDVQALKESGLILGGLSSHRNPYPGLVTQLAVALSEPWPESIIGQESPKALNALAFLGDSSRAVGGDGGGNIATWDVTSGARSQVRHVSDRPLYHVATDQDGHTILAVDQSGAVFVVRQGSAAPVQVRVSGVPDKLVESADGALGSFVVNDRVFRLDLRTGTPRPELVAQADRVLDLEPQAGGHIAALVRTAQTLRLVDVGTGHSLWERRSSAPELESGAISGDGSLAVTSGSQLLWSDGIADLRPTGQYVPDVLDALAITRSRLIIYSASAIGTRVFDLESGIQLPPICREIASMVGLAVAPSEDRVYCQGAGAFSIWNPAPVRPEAVDPHPEIDSRADSAGNLARAELSKDGTVAVTWRQGTSGPNVTSVLDLSGRSLAEPMAEKAVTLVLPGFSGPVTAVGISTPTNTLLVGSSDGVVMELDHAADGSWLISNRWQAPDRLTVRAASVDQGMLHVSTSRFAWSIPSCAGCSVNPLRLVARAIGRQLPCYSRSMGELIPADMRSVLKIRLCSSAL